MDTNWLEIGIGVFLLGMVLYGHWKGLIRLGVSMLALVITLTTVRFAMPYATDFIRRHTTVYSRLAERMEEVFRPEDPPGFPSEDPRDAADRQRRSIEEMELPDGVKNLLIENNTSEMYRLLGVDAFAEYIGGYLASLTLNLIGFAVLFLAVSIGLRLLAGALDLVARLPVLSGLNQLAGALLGGVHGLLWVWFFFFLLRVFSRTAVSVKLLAQVRDSGWLSFLYRYNLLAGLILKIVQRVFV